MSFADHFSTQADDYARYRPHYPSSLFNWLAAQVPANRCALDVATGSGQAAGDLSAHFQTVLGCEPSLSQLCHAKQYAKVRYICSTAEQLPFMSNYFDLIAVAQAAHWFDHPRFNQEAARVLKPGGLLAIWGYGLFRISDEIDTLIHDYYTHTLDGYWPPQRRWIEQAYAGLPFPFPLLDAPAFAIETGWNLPRVLHYLSTWSATQHYIAEHDHNPLDSLEQQLRPRWGAPEKIRAVRWPIFLLAGNKRAE